MTGQIGRVAIWMIDYRNPVFGPRGVWRVAVSGTDKCCVWKTCQAASCLRRFSTWVERRPVEVQVNERRELSMRHTG